MNCFFSSLWEHKKKCINSYNFFECKIFTSFRLFPYFEDRLKWSSNFYIETQNIWNPSKSWSWLSFDTSNPILIHHLVISILEVRIASRFTKLNIIRPAVYRTWSAHWRSIILARARKNWWRNDEKVSCRNPNNFITKCRWLITIKCSSVILFGKLFSDQSSSLQDYIR